MFKDFKCLPVNILFHRSYWDGPLNGVCEYINGEKLFFWCMEELMFKYEESDPAVIAVIGDQEEHCQYHRCRVYSLFKLPEEIMSDLVYNQELFEKHKNSKVDNWFQEYQKEEKKLPEYFNSYKQFFDYAWKFCVGYTTEDVWDREEYNRKRFT